MKNLIHEILSWGTLPATLFIGVAYVRDWQKGRPLDGFGLIVILVTFVTIFVSAAHDVYHFRSHGVSWKEYHND